MYAFGLLHKSSSGDDFHLICYQVLYGVPCPPSQTPRLAHICKNLGSNCIPAIIDHPGQLHVLIEKFNKVVHLPLVVFLKVDTGYHRAGVSIDQSEFKHLLERGTML